MFTITQSSTGYAYLDSSTSIQTVMRMLKKFSSTKVLSFLTLLFVAIPTSSIQAQVFESFESSAKSGYTANTVDLPSGTWFLSEALIGSDANDVKKSGTFAVRMGAVGAKLQMQFNKDGVGEVSFWYSISNFSGDKTRAPAVLQLRRSTNGGVSWQPVGNPFPATTEMIQAVFQINAPGNHRFEVEIVEGSPTGTRNRRVNIDDFRITNYVHLSETPTITAEINGSAVAKGSTFSFPATAVGLSRAVTLTLRNTGSQTLVLSDATFGGTGFRLGSSLNGVSIPSLGNRSFQLIFEPTVLKTYQDSIRIASNDPVNPTFTIKLTGPTFDSRAPISIAQARSLPLGTNVTVTGWITVGAQLGGPAYFQDATGGLAAFWPALHSAVQNGDSVVISGPLGEFGNTPGVVGDGLRQISVPTGSTDQILFTVHPSGRKVQSPKAVTINQLKSGNVEAQLVALENVTIVTIVNFVPSNTPFVGSFQANVNYGLRDASGNTTLLRIDNDTDLVGATAPSGAIDIVGVVGRFRGEYQIVPRSSADMNVEIFEIPYENVPKSQTFEAVTWNIEWFGSAGNGPTDVELQFTNVLRVIRTIDADLYALQEISNNAQFNRLVDSLRTNGYRGFVAPYSQTQKTAYLYKTSTVDSLLADFTGTEGQWGGGRWPYFFLFNATINGVTQRIRAINIHAKAFATQADYNERTSDSQILKAYMDQFPNQNLLLLGDFNDDVTFSTFNNLISPYINFVQDTNYKVITKSLSDRGLTSYSSLSNIDHIVANVRMKQFHLNGTERIENPSYVGNYLSTTSDHFPVWTRFAFADLVSVEDRLNESPAAFSLERNYPNPFNPSTVIGFTIGAIHESPVQVRLSIYDMLGREVAVLVDGVRNAGFHEVTFDARALSSGMYIYRLSTPQGSVSRVMTLLK